MLFIHIVQKKKNCCCIINVSHLVP